MWQPLVRRSRFCHLPSIRGRRFWTNPFASSTASFIDDQNQRFHQFTESTSKLRQTLFDEAVSMLIPEGMSPPELNKGFFYFQRYDSKGHLRFCRVPSDTTGKVMDIETSSPLEEELLSVGTLAEKLSDSGFADVSAAKINIGNSVLGFIADLRGDERWSLLFRDIAPMSKREYWKTQIPLVRNFEWIDNTMVPGMFLYYTEMDAATLRSFRVVRASISSSAGVTNTTPVWELPTTDQSAYVDLFKSKDGKCIFMSSSSKTMSEVRVVPSDDPDAVPRLIQAPSEGVEYYCEHHGEYVYMVSNKDFVNFALYRLPAAHAEADPELVYHSADMTITDIDMFRRGIVLYGHGFEGQPAVEVIRFKNCVDPDTVPLEPSDYDQFGIADIVQIPFKGNYAIGKVEIGVNGDFESDVCRFTFRNPRNPGTCMEFKFNDRKLEAVKSRSFQRKNAAVDSTTVVERVGVPSEDQQAMIPLTLVVSEKLAGAGVPGPCLLYVYGAYGQVLEPDFSPAVISLVNRGWTVAFAHVRGGGERGPEWHKAGSKLNRWNSVADLHSCCQWLFENKFTTPHQLATIGASAGGMVLGAALNKYGRAVFGGAAVLRVPFVDVFNTMSDKSLPLSGHEVDEWGNVELEEDAKFIKSIDPIANLVNVQGHYPPMLVTCAEDDSRVPYLGVVEYARKLKEGSGDSEVLLKTSKAGEGGHFGSASSAGDYNDTCNELAFILSRIT